MNYKVLVIGEDTRSFLSVIRSLGRSNYDVDVVCFDRHSPSLKSRYIKHAYFFNYQSHCQQQWLDDLVSLVTENKYDLIVPCDERSIFPLHSNKSLFPHSCRLAIPNQDVITHLFDKNTTKALAVTLDIPVATGKILAIKQIGYEGLVNEFGSNFVIKPTLSFIESNLSVRQKVAVITNDVQYQEYVKYIGDDDTYLVEKYFTGTGEGLSVLSFEGKIQDAFAHTRVNEPREGGGSSYRKAIDIDPSILEACAKLCSATQYTGVGMFEFKKNYANNSWILIEVNARFWGSLPLAIHAGIDFPKKYADLLLGVRKPNALANTVYNRQAFARSFSADIFDIKAEFEYNRTHQSLLHAVNKLMLRFVSFARLLKNEKIDSYDSKDKAPFIDEAKLLFNSTIGEKLKQKQNKNLADVQLSLLKKLHISRKPSIKFVCYGNIMRSPFAKHVLQLICKQTDLNWEVDSFGFHTNENRKSPQECIDAASKLGIDLQQHRSSCLRQKHIVPNNDIIIVFDNKNLLKISTSYETEHVFNLADFIPHGLGSFNEIEDPYGKGAEATEFCYLLISEAIKNIFEQYMRVSKIQ